MKQIKRTVAVISLIAVFLPFFALAEIKDASIPEGFNEAKERAEKVIEAAKQDWPQRMKNIWNEDILPTWQKMFDWFYQNIWSKARDWFKERIWPRVEEKKPVIEQEFEKEKEEAKTEIEQGIPGVGKSLWEKFKDLIR